mgnify:CR=1 FL=1
MVEKAVTGGSPTALRKRSVTLDGHRTSIALESAFWTELEASARRRGLALAALIGEVDRARGPNEGLASSLRLHVLRELKRR